VQRLRDNLAKTGNLRAATLQAGPDPAGSIRALRNAGTLLAHIRATDRSRFEDLLRAVRLVRGERQSVPDDIRDALAREMLGADKPEPALTAEVPAALIVAQATARGLDALAAALHGHGFDAVFSPDLPQDHALAAALRKACKQPGLACIALVTPSTPPARGETVAREATGYLLVDPLSEPPGNLPPCIQTLRANTQVPIFIRSGNAAYAQLADGLLAPAG
jgi:hypothetical protein